MRRLWLLFALLPACVARLSVPEGALITCEEDADCPPDWRCSGSISQCVLGPANQAPSVSLGKPERGLSTVELGFTLFDEEANATTIAAELIAAGKTIELAFPTESFASAREGVSHSVVIDLGAALGNTGFLPDLRVRLTPRDATGIGATVLSESFAFGNDPPAIDSIELEGTSGVIAVTLKASDSGGDIASVSAFELSTDDFQTVTVVPLDSGNFVDVSLLAAIPTSPQIEAPPLAWNTLASAAFAKTIIKVRVKVRDVYGAESDYVVSSELVIDNAPKLELLFVPTGIRPTGALQLVVDASDPNAAQGELLDLSLEYALVTDDTTAPTWQPFALTDGTPLTGFPVGRRTVTWDALAAAYGLAIESVDTSNGASAPVNIISYAHRLLVRAQLRDRAGLASEPVSVDLGAIGNSPPHARIVNHRTVSAYDIPISVTVDDSASDPSDLQVEFLEVNDTVYRTAALVLSNTSMLATAAAPTGVTHLVLWNSAAPRNDDPAVPQGVGSNLAKLADIRVRAIDRAGGGPIAYYGPWSEPLTLTGPSGDQFAIQVNNQTAPRVDNITFERLINSDGSSPVAIRYAVFDAESDPVDVRFQIALDGGDFGPCPEYPTPLSEDTRGLLSSPGGVEHVFVWNPTADRLGRAESVELRVTARDAKFATTQTTFTERLFPRGAQAAFVAPDESRYSLERPGGPSGPTGTAYAESGGFLASAADLNGDGLLDIVLSQHLGVTVEVYIAQGSNGIPNGTFSSTPQQFYCGKPEMDCGVAPIMTTTGMGLFDLNGDGHRDMLFVTDAAELFFLKGTGFDGLSQNSFITPAERYSLSPLTGAVYGVIVDELNGDAYPDLAVTTFDGDVAVFVGGPAAGPLPSLSLSFAAQLHLATFAGKLIPSDVDSDGDRDLIVSGDDLAPVTVILNGLSGATGSLSPAATPTIYAGGIPMALALMDIDDDGVQDLVLSRPRELVTFTGQTTAPYFTFRDVLVGPEVQASLFVGDVNADGFDDVIATEKSSNSVRNGVECYFGRGQNLAPPEPFFRDPVRAFTAATGLLNDDDVPDVAFVLFDAVNQGNIFMRTLLSTSTPVSATTSLMSSESWLTVENDRPNFIQNNMRGGDFNGDGIVDLAYSGPAALGPTSYLGELNVVLGQGASGFGNGQFAERVISFAGGATISFLEVQDLNNDGLSDIVLIRGTEVVIALASGSASFVASSTHTLTGNPVALRLADVSGDGVADIVINRNTNTGILVYLGAADGSFAPAVTVGTGAANTRATSTAVGDFTGDGLSDIIYRGVTVPPGSLFPAQGYLLAGVGAGAFTGPVALTGVILPAYTNAVDLNRDGALDLVSSGGNGGSIRVQLGQQTNGVANGTFAAVTTYAGHPQTSTAGRVFTTDADFDGVLDLVLFTLSKREIMMLKGKTTNGTPNGTFEPSTVWLTASGVGPSTLVVSDFNADDVPDWAVIHNESRLISLWYGQFQAQQAFAQAVRKSGASKMQAYGANVVEPDAGLMASNLGAKSVVMRPALLEAHSRMPDFWNALIRSGVTAATGLQALTEPWLVDGFQKVRRVPAPPGAEAFGTRLQLFERFGPLLPMSDHARSGLDLSAPRGIIVSLPLNRSFDHDTLSSALSPNKVRVFKQTKRLYRSDEVTSDPVDDPSLLPRALDQDGNAFDWIRYKENWIEIPVDDDGNFATGVATAERFIVRINPQAPQQTGTDVAKGAVQVLLAEPGTLQAFVTR